MGTLLLLILLFVGSSFLTESNDAATINLLGVAPEDVSYYTRGSVISCKDGHGSFPLERLNDDFCDCLDGTDEPGTSACPNGRFHCYNLQHKLSWIFSSRVNDGICDCCDGSDEYSKKTKCLVTCPEVLPLARELESILSEHTMLQVSTWKWKAETNALRDIVYKLRDLKILMMLEFGLVLLLCWQFYGWSRGRSSISRRRLKLPR